MCEWILRCSLIGIFFVSFHVQAKNLLLIIDAQVGYETLPQITENLAEEIQRAKEKDDWIIFIEHFDRGYSSPYLLSLVENYSRAYRLQKATQSGYETLFNFFIKKRVHEFENIYVAGINIDCAMDFTIQDILSKPISQNPWFSTKKLYLLKESCLPEIEISKSNLRDFCFELIQENNEKFEKFSLTKTGHRRRHSL